MKTMKTLSNYLTTGALVLAGTAATLAFGGSAQAIPVIGAFDASGNSAFNFSPTGNLGAANNFSVTLGTFDITGAINPFLGHGNDFLGLVGTQGVFVFGGNLHGPIPADTPIIDFGPGSLADPLIPRFHFRATGPFDVVSGSLTTVGLFKVGEFVDRDGVFDTSPASLSLTGNTSDVSSGVGSYSFSFSVPPATTSTPEPGTVLAVLAVAGAGALARRKG